MVRCSPWAGHPKGPATAGLAPQQHGLNAGHAVLQQRVYHRIYGQVDQARDLARRTRPSAGRKGRARMRRRGTAAPRAVRLARHSGGLHLPCLALPTVAVTA